MLGAGRWADLIQPFPRDPHRVGAGRALQLEQPCPLLGSCRLRNLGVGVGADRFEDWRDSLFNADPLETYVLDETDFHAAIEASASFRDQLRRIYFMRH